MFREEERRCLFRGGTVGIPFCMGKIERKTKVTRKQGQHESCLETAASKCIRVKSQPPLATCSDQQVRISCCILWMVWIFPHPRQNTRVDFSLSHTLLLFIRWEFIWGVCSSGYFSSALGEQSDGTGRNRKPWYKWLWLDQAWLAVTLDLILSLTIAFLQVFALASAAKLTMIQQ